MKRFYLGGDKVLQPKFKTPKSILQKGLRMINAPISPKQHQRVWKKASSDLEQLIGKENVVAWLGHSKLKEYEVGEEATIQVPTQLHQKRLKEIFYNAICQTLDIKKIKFVIDKSLIEPIFSEELKLNNEKRSIKKREGQKKHRRFLKLRRGFTFQNYYIGKFNHFASLVAKNVCTNPANDFSPAFIHGAPGCGKTHLLHAIAFNIQETHPDLEVRYLTSEEFQNHFVEACRDTSKFSKFRKWYREADVFIVDDINFLANKIKTQEELFNTLNTLYQANKQVVLSSDLPAEELEGFNSRLTTRFASGLTAMIKNPDYEDKKEVIRHLCNKKSITPPNNVIEYLAKNGGPSIRELEGLINNLSFMAITENKSIQVEMAYKVLPISKCEKKKITIEDIAVDIAEHFQINLEKIKGKSRSKQFVEPRHLICYLSKQYTPLSLKEIGYYLGGRDHTSVLHAINKITRARSIDNEFNIRIEELSEPYIK